MIETDATFNEFAQRYPFSAVRCGLVREKVETEGNYCCGGALKRHDSDLNVKADEFDAATDLFMHTR